jgi:hypothetical protein
MLFIRKKKLDAMLEFYLNRLEKVKKPIIQISEAIQIIKTHITTSD